MLGVVVPLVKHDQGLKMSDGCSAQSAKDKAKEIPTPEVLEVPSYRTDYLPTFREKQIYTRTSASSLHA